jgi:hypothetical protein
MEQDQEILNRMFHRHEVRFRMLSAGLTELLAEPLDIEKQDLEAIADVFEEWSQALVALAESRSAYYGTRRRRHVRRRVEPETIEEKPN